MSGKPPVPRFNMPFELGLVLGLHGDGDHHAWFIFETVRHRAARSLSDVAGYDVEIHNGQAEGMLRAITNAFGAKKRHVTHPDLVTLWRALSDVVPRIKEERESLFTRTGSADLVVTGQSLAREHFAARAGSGVPVSRMPKRAK